MTQFVAQAWMYAASRLSAVQAMHTIHLFAYKYDGDGLKACEVLSEILFMLAQAGLGDGQASRG